jgi:UDP-N-acetylglucosamine acyltransferase
VYIAHDCLIESDTILCARVSLSGHCHVLKGAILGLSCSLHQFSTVGAHSFVGMGSVVVKDVPPFCLVMGNPAHFAKFNSYSLESLGVSLQDLAMDNNSLRSDHPYVQECLRQFEAHKRRESVKIF